MKRALIILVYFRLLSASTFSANAQDYIFLQNENVIKAKVIEVNSSRIWYKQPYKDFDHNTYNFDEIYDSPIIKSIANRKVFAIDYENGMREIINPIRANTRQSKAAIGISPVVGMGGILTNFGICGKLQYNVIKPIRLEGSFTWFLPKTVSENIFGVTVNREFRRMWNINANMHFLISIGDNFILYPLAGIGIIDLTGKTIVMDEKVGETAIRTAINTGGGFDIKIANQLFFNAELKYLFLFEKGDIGRRLMISAGLAYKF